MEKLEVRTENWEQGSQKSKEANRFFEFLALHSLLLAVLLFSGCATTIHELPPAPPKYVYKEERPQRPSVNSLWVDSGSMFEDRKARRLNDLVTVKVIENITASGKADTSTGRDSSADFGLTNLLGMNNDFNLHNAFLLKDLYKGANVFSPTIQGNAKSDFEGKGDTSREGKLIGTITAKVTDVMPNGNLVLESRKDITINNEKQILVFRGMVRPDDIAGDNTVVSSKVADAEIFYVGDGVIQDKQKPGWLVRILDNVWPF